MSGLFIHVPRTGGTSIKHAMGVKFDPLSGAHPTAVDIIRRHGLDYWRGHFTFAFVRNPWERMLSIFNMLYDPATSSVDFRTWIGRPFSLETGSRGQVQPWRLQTDYFCEVGVSLVDFVGHYETLQKDWANVALAFGAEPVLLPHLNRGREIGDYRDYYDAESRDIVAEHIAADIAFGGYKF